MAQVRRSVDHLTTPNCQIPTPPRDYDHYRSAGRLVDPVGEGTCQEWQELDRLLIRFWTSRLILMEIRHEKRGHGGGLRVLAPILLPELTQGGRQYGRVVLITRAKIISTLRLL